jgi:hypothetical protein
VAFNLYMLFEPAPPAYVILFFVNSDCPIARRYSPEINRIAKEFQKGFTSKLVYCDQNVSARALKNHHNDFKFSFDFITDPKHLLTKQFKVSVVPTAVVVDKSNRVLYRGRIDDSYGSDFKWRKPKQLDLRNALSAIQSGKPVKVKETTPVGCTLSL